jgi:tRNA-specific 2-thiouridylase
VGICFVGKVNLKKFLQKKIKPKKGKILDPQGKVIGEHDGIYYYTIGQRLGPRYGFELDRGDKNKPSKWYVAAKDVKKNILVAAPEGHILNFRKDVIARDIHFIDNSLIDKIKRGDKLKILSRIRHVGELLPSILFYDKKSKQFKVILKEAITGVSEGQAIVFYEGEKVLGGGEIKF